MNYFYEILNSKNFIPLSVFAACLVFLCYILVKKGILTIHTKYVSTGLVERERKTIRHQMTHAYQSCTAFISKLPFIEGCSKEQMRNVCELIYDEMITWVVFNHIKDTGSYVSIHQEAIWNIILRELGDIEKQHPGVKELVFNNVQKDIETFVKIRKEYSK